MPVTLRAKTAADLIAEAAAERVVKLDLWAGDLQTVFGRFQLRRVELPTGETRYQLVAVDTYGARFLHGTGDTFYADERVEAATDAEATRVALTLLWNRFVEAARDFNGMCEQHGCEAVAWPDDDDTGE